VIYTMTLN